MGLRTQLPSQGDHPDHRPRPYPTAPELTRMVGDFWLIDGRQVVAMHYQPDGQFRAAETLEPQHVAEHRTVAEIAWELGEGFTTWWNDRPLHHRSAHWAA
ncbi:MAG: DUF6879 family protein [Pseudonocardiaceae bacterium]